MARRWSAVPAVAMVACFSGGWLLQRQVAAQGDVYQQARLFETVLAHVRDYHVDSIAEPELYRKAADGLLAGLRDPYAALLSGRDLESHVERTTGDYAGIGLLVDARNGWITVVSPMQGSPAERAGIRSGDLLFEVDGEPAENWGLDRAVRAMRGPVGTGVDVAVRREGTAEPLRFRLVRERIHQPAVPAGLLLSDGVGYLSMTLVRENAAEELEREVEELVEQGMRVLLLDLRGNPGGLRDEAVEVADLFLDPREEILVSRGRAPGDNHRWADYRPQRWPDLPLVVLVGGGTASAAEIVAGALQDHDRALIVGDTTYGKGIVQTVFALAPDLALRMTTARWYTPSGRSIQGVALDSAMGAEPRAESTVAYSSGGRRLEAGSGLVPDVVLGPDTLTSSEADFAQSLGDSIAVFRDVLTAYALELKRAGGISRESFQVTPGMRAEVARRLGERGVPVVDSVFEGASRIVAQQLGYEIARYRFGPAAERKRRAEDDPQIRRAVELVRGSTSPRALVGLAGPTSPQAY
ncbi:MAG TPA: S41 family peptidase [Gemmatimonadales bacterium]|nr:S41 family peptidase [Gemmatimonadales bacterium]